MNRLIAVLLFVPGVALLLLVSAANLMEGYTDGVFASAENGVTKQKFDVRSGLFRDKELPLSDAPRGLFPLPKSSCLGETIHVYEYGAFWGAMKFHIVFSDGKICYAYPTYMTM